MIYFTANNTVNRKVIFSALLVLSFVMGLIFYFSNQHMFSNYKSYYFKSYSYILPYKLKEIGTGLHVFGRSGNSDLYAESIPVLLYHGVLGGTINNGEGEATNIDLATFWDQMKTLK